MNRLRARWFALLAGLLSALALGLGGCKKGEGPFSPPGADPAKPGGPASYLFCHWNVENFFDDKLDNRHGRGDAEYDSAFADNPDLLRLKLKKLGDALLKMNDGKGPDILAVVEAESERAAELLQKALNDRLKDKELHYRRPLMREVSVGRHIAPAILSRLPLKAGKPFDKRMRILEGRVTVNGHDLVVIAAHWTSRLGSKVGGRPAGDKQRRHYAERIYGRVRELWTANRKVDVLICGDFNDTPADPSVTEALHASDDERAVRQSGDELRLFNLLGGKDPRKFGTHYHSGWFIFDQLLVSPGMLDREGWSCDPASVRTVNALHQPGDSKRRPWKFGGPNYGGERGYSDHFPVTVELKVAGP
jgi:endonuclease/exonuclease/phosphatase family metal-dependent hydrolase